MSHDSAQSGPTPSSISAPTHSADHHSPSAAPGSPESVKNQDQASAKNDDTAPEASSTPAADPKAEKPADKKDDKKDEKVSSKFASLARKERQVVAKQEELKAEVAKLADTKAKMQAEVEAERLKVQADQEAFASKIKEYDEFQNLKRTNPLKAMEALGFTYQQLTDIVLNEGKPTAEMEIARTKSELETHFKSELEALKKSQAEEKERTAKEAKEREEKQAEAEKKRLEAESAKAEAEFKGNIQEFLAQNEEKYELAHINYGAEQATEYVYAIIDEHYQKTLAEGKPKILSVGEASDMFESYLEQQLERNLATKKVKAKVTPPQADKGDSKANSPVTSTANKQTPKTLNNDMTASSLSSPAKSDEERIKRALAALDARR